MKRHPTDGTLRRLLDEPVGVADADRAHVAGCPTCLAELAQARSDAAVAAAAMTPSTAGIPDVDEGWRRLSAGLTIDRARSVVPPVVVVRPRWGARLRTPVVAIAGVVLLMTGAGIAAAADWLPIFRTEQIAPVTITADDLVALPDLSAYGDVTVVDEPGVHPFADLAAAAAETGLTVPQVAELPGGVSG